MESRKRPENIPPTPVPGLDLRMWFAGCALANSSIVTASDPDQASQQAIDVADKLLAALKSKAPTKASMKPPNAKQMKRWDARIENSNKQTMPALKKRKQNDAGRYSSVIPDRER